jgi:hypothetical protein
MGFFLKKFNQTLEKIWPRHPDIWTRHPMAELSLGITLTSGIETIKHLEGINPIKPPGEIEPVKCHENKPIKLLREID